MRSNGGLLEWGVDIFLISPSCPVLPLFQQACRRELLCTKMDRKAQNYPFHEILAIHLVKDNPRELRQNFHILFLGHAVCGST